MNDFDVSVRLRLQNQLSREADKAERDLKALRKAADDLNRRTGAGLDRELGDVARRARDAGKALELPADKMRALNRLTTDRVTSELGALRTASDQLSIKLKVPGDRLRDLNRISTDRVQGELRSLAGVSDQLGAKISAAMSDLKAVDTVTTNRVEAEFKSLGKTIDDASTRLDRFRKASGQTPSGGTRSPGGTGGGSGVDGRAEGRKRAAEALYDRTPMGAYVPLGSGGATAAGAGVAAAGLAAVQGFRKFASADRRMTVLGMNVGASEEETRRVGSRVRKMATDLGIPHEQAVAGLEDIVAAGVESFDEALSMLPTALKAAMSSGTPSAQMATALKATQDSMGIGAAQVPLAADTIITGGRMGKFEVEDMARYLPSLLPLAASQLGYSGLGGLQQVAADLQTVRDKSGTSEEAATRLTDFYSKIFSEATQKNFSDRGFNLKRTVDTAVAQGEDPVAAAIELTQRVLKKDPTSLTQLFTDKEARLAAMAFLADPGGRARYRDGMQGAAGTTEESFGRVTNDSQASIDRLSNGFWGTMRGLGAVLDALGASHLLNATGGAMNNLAEDGIMAFPQARVYDRYWNKGAVPWLLGRTGEKKPAVSPFPQDDLADPGLALQRYLGLPLGASVPVPLPKPKLDKMTGTLGAAGTSAGREFATALGAEAERAGAIADELKARFSFTATPTITPSFSAAQASPTSARGGGAGVGPTTINQRINGGADPVRTARAVNREQNRAIRAARARALHDTGSLV
jgi:TP901 family phage tail tape measure protein